MRQPVRMRSQKHCINSRERRPHPDAEDQRKGNGCRFAGILLHPVFGLEDAGARRGRGASGAHTFAGKLRCRCRVVNCLIKNLLGLFTNRSSRIANYFAGFADGFTSILCPAFGFIGGTSRVVSQFWVV